MYTQSSKILHLDVILQKAREDPEMLAVLRFGSTAREKKVNSISDLDLCLVLYPKSEFDSLCLSQKKHQYARLSPSSLLDLQIFQQLPLYIRKRVLKDGEVLFCKDEEKLYRLAFRTAQEFGDFEHIYREYLEEIAHV